MQGHSPKDPAPGLGKHCSFLTQPGRKPAPRSALTCNLHRLSCWHSAGNTHRCQGIGFPPHLALSMALTHQSLLQEPTCTLLHLPWESFLQQSHFPDLFHVLPEEMPSCRHQWQCFGMIHTGVTPLDEEVWWITPAWLLELLLPHPTLLVAGILLEAQWPEGNTFVPTATSVCCPEPPAAMGSTVHTTPPRKGNLSWGHPVPKRGLPQL